MIRQILKLTLMLFVLLPGKVYSDDAPIKIIGLERYLPDTILSYLPPLQDDLFTPQQLKLITEKLYESNFFENIELYSENNILIIKVTERPAIASITFQGNELIESAQLLDSLKLQGITQNRPFNRSFFDLIQRELKEQYFNAGYYAVKIDSTVRMLDNNQAELSVTVEEGEPAKIQSINIIGNHQIPSETLLALFDADPFNPKALFNKDDYRSFTLQADFERIRNYYLNNGYADFRIKSSQIALSPELKGIYITLNLHEGDPFTIKQQSIRGFEPILNTTQVAAINQLKVGDTFSNAKIRSTIESIQNSLGNKGYAFANLSPNISLNRDEKTASILVNVNPGEKIYVTRIEIKGNRSSKDYVIRRELRQYEGALYIPSKVRLSETRLNRTGFFSNVSIQSRRISANQVVLTVQAEDASTGSFNAQLGFTLTGGASFGLSLSEKNWIGTGRNIDLSLQDDDTQSAISLSITNPYFRPNNISLAWNVNASERRATNLTSGSYLTNTTRLGATLGIPYSETGKIFYGLNHQATQLTCNSSFTECTEFVQATSSRPIRNYATLSLTLDSRNRGLFPTDGNRHSLQGSFSLPGDDVQTYVIEQDSQWYFPTWRNSAFLFKSLVGITHTYDNEAVPFFSRFYAGGPSSIRGFISNSVGETYNSDTDGVTGATGGDLLIENRLEWLFPPPNTLRGTSSNSMRFSVFLDSGNVYQEIKEPDLRLIRSAYGASFQWITPIGPLAFSYAQPLNYLTTDSLQEFQFSLGSIF